MTSGTQVTTYTYDPNSNVATVTYPNGIQSTFTYDMLTASSGYGYTLGARGNRQQANEPGGRVINWAYDDLYRLTNETARFGAYDLQSGSRARPIRCPIFQNRSSSNTLPIGSGSAHKVECGFTLRRSSIRRTGNPPRIGSG